jgi:SAM-dependent methyltransferase
MSFGNKISAYNRRRKWRIFLEKIKPSSKTVILDVGFSEEEYRITDNYLEKHYLYPHNITALGIDVPKKFIERYPQVQAVQYDGRKFPFKDQEFNVCWSNAVIEHVGNKDEQILFLKEIKRVAKVAFITTPNKHFPFEVHTGAPLIHILFPKIFDKYASLIGRQWATSDHMTLLSLGDIQNLLASAEIYQYSIIQNKLLLFTLDYVILFGNIMYNDCKLLE